MSENLPAVPELQPSRFTCQPCKISYPMGKESTAYLYRKQAWFNHIDTNCVKCHRHYTVWGITQAQMNHMAHHNVTQGDRLVWKIADFCDDIKVIREFCEDNHKNPPPDLWLSARRMKDIDTKVAWFAYLLDHGEAP